MAEYSYESEQEKLKRRRMLAQAISAGGQMPQGQMVGNRYVAPHPLQQLAAVGQQLTGAYIDRNTNKQEASLKEQERKRMAEVLRGLIKPGGVISEEGAMGGAGMPGQPSMNAPLDPQREAAMAVLRDLPLEAQREIVGQQAAAKLFPKPQKFERVDLGNEIGIMDETGKIVQLLPKGVTPDAQLGADTSRIGHRVTMRGQDLTTDTTRRGQDVSAETSRRGQDLTYGASVRGQDISAENAAVARANKPLSGPDADAQTKLGQVSAVRASLPRLKTSSDNLSDYQTGPIAGRRAWMGGMTDAEQIFESDVAAVTGQILAATKVPGTGAQSDRDAARLDALTPKLSDDKAARDRKMEGLSLWLDEIEITNRGILKQTPQVNAPSATDPKARAESYY